MFIIAVYLADRTVIQRGLSRFAELPPQSSTSPTLPALKLKI